jgi:Xaa-Pro aminopeptidase
MFDQEVYIQRRRLLQAKLQKGILLFIGNDESPINFTDNTYHFRQDSTFLYYFGISQPGLAAIIDLEEDRTILFGNELTIDEIVWMGRQKTLQEKGQNAGLTIIKSANSLSGDVQKYIDKGSFVHFLPPYRAERKIKLANLLHQPITQIEQQASIPFIKAVVAQRSVKSAEEIVEIDKAAALSADMHLLIMQYAKPGMYEQELAAKIHEIALSTAGNLAYPPIVTVQGEILHNHYYGNQLREGQMLLNDSGVETDMGYAGDLTRTFPVGKKFTAIQKDVYNIVLEAYTIAKNMLAPGVRYLDVHLTSCKTLAQGLKDMGLMKGNVDDAVAAGAHAMFFQCGTGHMMGLDVCMTWKIWASNTWAIQMNC